MQAIELLKMRRDAGVKQADLAKQIGYSRQSIVAWERGVHPIPADVVPLVIKACTAQSAQSDESKAKRELIRETLAAYTKMRKDFDHATILEVWAKYNFTPSQEAQAAIVEAFPDILEQANG